MNLLGELYYRRYDSALLWMKSLSSGSKLFVSNNIYGELQMQVQDKAVVISPTHFAIVLFSSDCKGAHNLSECQKESKPTDITM